MVTPLTIDQHIALMASNARRAARVAASLTTEAKNQLLKAMAAAVEAAEVEILTANAQDVEAARASASTASVRGTAPSGFAGGGRKAPWGPRPFTGGRREPPMIDRLTLTPARIADMAGGLREVAVLPDPVGVVVKAWDRPNGLHIEKVRIPLGVIGMIYEARPNVTVDAAGLCLKSGNAIILRGGSEAIHSNACLGRLLQQSCKAAGVDPDVIQVLPMTDRLAMQVLVEQTASIDLMIPRGGAALMQWMAAHSKVPVLKHDKGVCHVFIDRAADPQMAEEIVFNAKVHRPGVCNALETCLVDAAIATQVLPALAKRLGDAGVEIRGCAETCKLIADAKPATEDDWYAEYLDLILAIRVVPNLEAAMEHIARHGSHHTEVIVTGDAQAARRFLQHVDASAVMWNASTRFNDGGELGLGAEIGISTTKLHAYGPMGLEELTTTKYVVTGTGHVRS